MDSDTTRGGAAMATRENGDPASAGRTVVASGTVSRGSRPIVLSSRIDAFEEPTSVRWWVLILLCAAVLLGSAYLIVRFVACRVLLLDLDPPKPDSGANLGKELPARNLVVVQPPFPDRRISWAAKLFHQIDLEQVGLDDNWKWDPKTIGDKPAAVVTNIETGMDDYKVNRAKLALVESLVAADKRVVMVSSVPPLRFPLESCRRRSCQRETRRQQAV